MSAQPIDLRLSALESSMAHLDGAYEQIDKRLGDLRSDMTAGFLRVDQRFDSAGRKIEGNFRALIGWMLAQTAIIIGALASVAFALKH